MELDWRRAKGKPVGFDSLKSYKPIMAVGAEHPLTEEVLMADNFRMPISENISQPLIFSTNHRIPYL